MIQDHAFTFGWTLLHFLWQGAALALLVWIVLGLSRRARPEMRYALACGGFTLMTLAPVVTYGILRQTEPIPASVNLSGAVQVSPSVRITNVTKSSAATTAMATRPSMRTRLDLLAPWLVLIWGLGVLILMGRMVGGASWLIQAQKRSRSEEGIWSERLEILQHHMGIARTVVLRILDDLDGPVVVGWIKPVILIPASILTGLPATQVELLLAHELAHVARHDYATNLIQRFVETLLFFHPAVWWLGRRVRQERERCCDAMAADLLGDPCGMAEALTSLEDMRLVGPWPAFALGATGGFLGERVRVLLNLEEHPNRLRIAMASGLVILCALSGLGLWKLRAHRLSNQWGSNQQRWNLGRIQIRLEDEETVVEFNVKHATAAEVLEAFGRLSNRQATSGSSNHQENIQPIPVPAGQPDPERYTVEWSGLKRAQFLEYWHRIKARPPLECPQDTVVVRRDNLALPWDRAEQSPLDIWVPKHADEFSVEAARLVREAILELESKAPTPGLPQEARRKVPEAIMTALKSPDPGSPLLRCGDSWKLEQYAKRAQEEPFEPAPELRYTLNTLAILDLPTPSAAERKLVQSKQEAINKHDALNKWKHLLHQGSSTRRLNRPLTSQEKRNLAKKVASSMSPQEQKDFAAWQDQHAKLLAENQQAEDALEANQNEKGFQIALQRVKQRLSKLPAEPSKPTSRNAKSRVSINIESDQDKAWLRIGGLCADPGLLRQSPGAEAEVLRTVEATLQTRLERFRTAHVKLGDSANRGKASSKGMAAPSN